MHSWVILCLGTRLDTKSLTRARFLLFPSTRDGTSISYIGKITNVGYDDEAEVRFMSTYGKGRSQKWRKHKDKLWMSEYSTLTITDEPEAAKKMLQSQ